MRTVAATPQLVPFLLERMGPARVAAMQARHGMQLEAGIAADIAHSTLTWCGLDDFGVVTFGGIIPMPDGAGYCWQYVTDIVKNKRGYLRQHREILGLATQQYRKLVTIIEADYEPALRHVWRLGFTVKPPRDFDGVLACLCIRESD